MTPASFNTSGAAYSTAGVTLGPQDIFSTTFQFRISNASGINPADGFTFVLAANPTGLGATGGGLGYQGVTKSVAIEFDTFFNGGIDSSSNHVAIDTGGSLNNLNSVNPYGIGSCGFTTGSPAQNSNLTPGCLSNGDLWSVTIGYNGSALSVSVWDKSGPHAESAPFTVYSSFPINIASTLGTNTAFVGFTAGTGSGIENHDILNWQFADTTVLASVPEPATLTLFFGGAAALWLLKRRLPEQ